MRLWNKTTRVFLLGLALVVFTVGAARADQGLKVAMVLWRGQTSAETAFMTALAELGFEPAFTLLDAGQSQERLAAILKDLDPEKYDYIYTFGTTVSLAAKARLMGRAPQVFNIVNSPELSGLVLTMNRPGPNLSGVTNATPVDLLLDLVVQSFKPRRLGLIYNVREPNSREFAARVEGEAAERGLEVGTIGLQPGAGAIDKAFQALVSPSLGVDVLVLPPDSYLLSQPGEMGRHLAALRIPSVSIVGDFIEHGALMGLVADYGELGRQAAAIIALAEKGNRLGTIPVRAAANPRLMVNTTRLKALGLTLPPDIMRRATLVE